jgi:hypothetical protein
VLPSRIVTIVELFEAASEAIVNSHVDFEVVSDEPPELPGSPIHEPGFGVLSSEGSWPQDFTSTDTTEPQKTPTTDPIREELTTLEHALKRKNRFERDPRPRFAESRSPFPELLSFGGILPTTTDEPIEDRIPYAAKGKQKEEILDRSEISLESAKHYYIRVLFSADPRQGRRFPSVIARDYQYQERSIESGIERTLIIFGAEYDD